ncbi:hypothetical protein KC19_4G264400 [Ceratodon purpureus]|uniref:Uncharacterized protein n=1 Tax=Ceratodon purpureus TaxID=3225 RepID=A0A8T0ICY2_CERPU|nr:hypothetical protein KC19_4G264400 [Ceratodon purpureus]
MWNCPGEQLRRQADKVPAMQRPLPSSLQLHFARPPRQPNVPALRSPSLLPSVARLRPHTLSSNLTVSRLLAASVYSSSPLPAFTSSPDCSTASPKPCPPSLLPKRKRFSALPQPSHPRINIISGHCALQCPVRLLLVSVSSCVALLLECRVRFRLVMCSSGAVAGFKLRLLRVCLRF